MQQKKQQKDFLRQKIFLPFFLPFVLPLPHSASKMLILLGVVRC